MNNQIDKSYQRLYFSFYPKFIRDYRPRLYSIKNKYIIRVEFLLNAVYEGIDLYFSNSQVRWDARYYLLVNFCHMIVLPLHERYTIAEGNGQDALQILEEKIKSDLFFLSSEMKIENEGDEISAHQIIKLIDKNWDVLFTTNSNQWL
jgi:hypothetical protein